MAMVCVTSLAIASKQCQTAAKSCKAGNHSSRQQTFFARISTSFVRFIRHAWWCGVAKPPSISMETHHEQVHRRSAASRRHCNKAGEDPHGRARPWRPSETVSNFVQVANAQKPNTAREQALRECSFLERRDTHDPWEGTKTGSRQFVYKACMADRGHVG
jgi:hypothetical protein